VSDTTPTVDGMVLYVDGSFRRGRAGWGFHGYTYQDKPLTRGIGIKQLPTTKGYAPMALPDTVTPLEYFDAFGPVTESPTNNTGELQAAIEAFRLAIELDVPHLYLLLDSEYVRKGLTQWVKGWTKRNWMTSQGEPVANKSYWLTLIDLETKFKDGRSVELVWIKGHSGDVGNDLADFNARTGSGNGGESYLSRSPVEGYHNPKTDVNPLYLKTRMLFNLGGSDHRTDGGCYYYQYQLGRLQSYGHKQQDTQKDRHDKTDLLLGRRIADATFCVVKVPEADEYLESLIDYHAQAHQRDIVELAIARLDIAYKPAVYQRIRQVGDKALIPIKSNGSLITPNDDLVTKTLDPPRLAMEAVNTFANMERQLNGLLENTLGKHVDVIDITDTFYGRELKGKTKEVVSLHKHITNTTPTLDIPTEFKGQTVTLKLVLGVDIPQRNALAKLAGEDTRVSVLVMADGPLAYSFATVFQTAQGSAIYQSPYTRFVLPKSHSEPT